MHLLIDVGNTRLKWLLVKDKLNDNSPIMTGLLDDLEKYISQLDVGRIQVHLAAVNLSTELKQMLSSAGFCNLYIARAMAEQKGVRNSYSQPERMGIDRWLAMVAGYNDTLQASKQGVIVVDAGSALTIDVVDPSGQHMGGLIVPGLLMAKQALFVNTERVIKYEEERIDPNMGLTMNKLGNNTVECVEYGVVTQLCLLIQSTIKQYPTYDIIMTGGDAELLLASLDLNCVKRITIDKYLVLKGLWQVRN